MSFAGMLIVVLFLGLLLLPAPLLFFQFAQGKPTGIRRLRISFFAWFIFSSWLAFMFPGGHYGSPAAPAYLIAAWHAVWCAAAILISLFRSKNPRTWPKRLREWLSL